MVAPAVRYHAVRLRKHIDLQLPAAVIIERAVYEHDWIALSSLDVIELRAVCLNGYHVFLPPIDDLIQD
jgi:hypothetical protein